MDKHIIGENAGVIWRLLNNGERWEYESLKAASGLSDRDLNLAIGWLARENKIFFERSKDQDKEYMYLSIDLYL
ncbi:winged helix-turn-helix domain-containing protein [Bacteroides caecigallinarum]|uniref:winged helix-turn-helix domain-containing protein n=1 Tax=Bacteroides TaxID=816 RepID=UPI000821030C|nr:MULTISPECIES: winged helix-turn-helix domain-containing protein [Bacteroides]MBM6959320.1 winged helix-turn-helix domain-containing protein [Bacteroides caecigallinarum]MCF2738212.1 winged helix-turn-helix domain-containing protein [Bacteroides caecigallinarum]MCR8893926.1 winged helix-turn-helix domain-containing protein [Bacteroides sp. ET336]MCU6771114.1 winged helix-turn-helix domain-containing protein [Bacteroides cellulolyticus]MDN0051540.1 winged helix-turn-helix domain-containing pr